MKNRSAHWPQHRKHSIKYKPPLLLLLVSVAPGISKAEANLNVFAVGRKIHLDDKARDVLAVADAVQAGALHEVIEVDGVFGRTDGQEPAVRADPRESDPGARSPRGRAGGRSAPGPVPRLSGRETSLRNSQVLSFSHVLRNSTISLHQIPGGRGMHACSLS